MPANQMTDNNNSSFSEAPHAWGTTGFVPGQDIGLVARHTVGLIARENPSTRARLWTLVSNDALLDDILDELSSTGLKALPDFGIAQLEGDSVRVVARGRTVISAELAGGGTHEVDASDVRTWIEEVIADVTAITITLSSLDGDSDGDGDGDPDEVFAVLAGSVPARSLTRRYDVADEHAAIAESRWSAQAVQSPAAAHEAPHVGEPSDALGLSEPELAEAPEADLEMLPDDAGSVAEAFVAPASSDSWFDSGADERAPAAPQPAHPQPAPPMLDMTADPEELATHRVFADVPPSGAGLGGAPPEPTVVIGSDDGQARGPVTPIFDEDVVGELPGDDEPIPFSSPELADVLADGGNTVSPAVADAGVFAVLSFSNGERINIDRPVLIGRNPKVAGTVKGGLPHIMKFDGPGQGLSRSHAEIRIEDGEIVLEDLQSTNGTEIQLPGRQRRRLRGGESVAVVPGTLIDFGDELHCTVETAN
ncbi:MAG: hypothetical protein ACJAR2_003446 [Ilumatobacter sp.]|jgi:hypothetical protein